MSMELNFLNDSESDWILASLASLRFKSFIYSVIYNNENCT